VWSALVPRRGRAALERTQRRGARQALLAARAARVSRSAGAYHARGVDILLAPPVLVSRAAAGAAAAVVRHGVSWVAVRAAGAEPSTASTTSPAQIVREPTLATYAQLVTQPANVDIVLRT
jgi:hypothetical protein